MKRFLIYGLRDPRDGAVRYIGQSSRETRAKMSAAKKGRPSNTLGKPWTAERRARQLGVTP